MSETLPETWLATRLGDLIEVKYGKALKAEDRKHGHVPVYGSNGQVGEHDSAITMGETILVGRKGSVGAIHYSSIPCWPIDTVYFVDGFGPFIGQFLSKQLGILRLNELDSSSAIPGLNRDQLYDSQVVVAPEAEQRRIVAKLDTLQSRTRRAREALAAIPALLDHYRQSVLAAAFRGELTTEWRKENGSVLVPSAPIESDDLPALPIGWAWKRIGELGRNGQEAVQTGPFGAQLHSDEFVATGVPVIAVGNLTGMGFTTEGLYFITEQKAELLARYDVNAGDLLFARSGATLGKVCVAPSNVQNWRMTGHILRVRLNQAIICSDLVAFALAGCSTVVEMVKTGIRGMTRPGYNTSLLAAIPVPVPPIDEQRVIIRRINELFSRIAEIEALQTRTEAAISQLDQSILATAFRGELVPQDPADEPTSVLLDRIRAARAQAGDAPRTRRVGRPGTAPSSARAAEPTAPYHTDISDAYATLLNALRTRGSISSADAQASTGLDAAAVRPLLQRLVAEGAAKVEGQKRGTRYVAIIAKGKPATSKSR